MRSWNPLYAAAAIAAALLADPGRALASPPDPITVPVPVPVQPPLTVTTAPRRNCPSPELRRPILIGPNNRFGSGARAKAKAKSTALGLVGGLLGGGGNNSGAGSSSAQQGPRLSKCKIKDSEMTVFTDPETGISLKVGAKRDGDGLVIFSEIDESPDSGTFQAAVIENANNEVLSPSDVGICDLWGEWKLTVSWTKTTYVDNQVVKRESGGWQKTGLFTLPGMREDGEPDGIWQRLGFSNASHGARKIALRYPLPADDGPLNAVIHVTRPGRDPVDTVPFGLSFEEGPGGIVFTRERKDDCPPGGLLLADSPHTQPRPAPAANTPEPRPPETTGETPPPTPQPVTTTPPTEPQGEDPRDEDEECPYPTGKITLDLVDAEADNLFFGTTETYTDLADIVRIATREVAPHYDPRAECGRCIRRLDIWGHGDLAGGWISFGSNDAVTGTTVVGDLLPKFQALGRLMCIGGEIVLNQCKGGSDQKGTDALQIIANNVGVTASAPENEIEGCRVIGGMFSDYKNVEPAAGSHTPADNAPRPVQAPPTPP